MTIEENLKNKRFTIHKDVMYCQSTRMGIAVALDSSS